MHGTRVRLYNPSGVYILALKSPDAARTRSSWYPFPLHLLHLSSCISVFLYAVITMNDGAAPSNNFAPENCKDAMNFSCNSVGDVPSQLGSV